jgi:hypothetical protein
VGCPSVLARAFQGYTSQTPPKMRVWLTALAFHPLARSRPETLLSVPRWNTGTRNCHQSGVPRREPPTPRTFDLRGVGLRRGRQAFSQPGAEERTAAVHGRGGGDPPQGFFEGPNFLGRVLAKAGCTPGLNPVEYK